MSIPERIIEEIQGKSDIVEIISGYVLLKKMGRSYKAPCPFHHEKTPSFIVSPEKQIFHCFGCGAGGNVFSFIMKHENMQFPEAVEFLAEKAGIRLPKSAGREESDSFANELYKINDAAAKFFQASLENKPIAKEYLSLRGVGDEVRSSLKIGYAPDAWESLLNFFKAKGVDVKTLEKAGLVISNEKGGYYDRFRNRMIFPIMDLKERVLGFGARVLDSSLPKYINSPETSVYSKGKNLYGLNFSKDNIRKEKHAIIVEGYLDFIVPYQAGVKNVIATLGTALTTDQIKLIKRYANTAIILYDPDAAGESASLRNLDLFISEDVNVYIAELSDSLDPDAYIRKFGVGDFLKKIKSAKNIFEYKLEKLKKRYDAGSTNGKAAIVAAMLPTIARINNAVLKSEFLKKLSERLSVDEEAIRSELKKIKSGSYEPAQIPVVAEARHNFKTAEMMLLALMLEDPIYIERIKLELGLEDFKDTSVRDVCAAIFRLHGENIQVTPVRLITDLARSPEGAKIVSEASGMLENMTDKEKAFLDCITKIKRDNVKDKLSRIQEEIKMAHGRKDEDSVKDLVAKYSELIKEAR